MPNWFDPYLTWAAWAPVFSTGAIAGIVGWICRTPLTRWIEGRISSGFEKELEDLKANLRAREADIASLRSGAITSLAARHSEIERRKIEAVDTVWKATVALGSFKGLSLISQSINMEFAMSEVAKKSIHSKSIQDFADMIIKSFKVGDIKLNNSADDCRVFLPAIAWALFSAYRQTLYYSLVQFNLLKAGLDGKRLTKVDAMMEMLKSALPHQAAYIDEYKASSFPYLIEELEQKALSTLSSVLSDSSYAENAVADAARINNAVSKVKSDEAKIDLPAELSSLVRN